MAGDAQTFSWALLPFHFWSAVYFLFGGVVGSFLNVCIYRMPRDLSLAHPPSHCPHCKYAIPFYLNVPLVTWVMLRGRCKNCGAPISVRYLLVELLTGLVFLACWLRFGRTGDDFAVTAMLAFSFCMFLAGLIVATFIDMEHYIIPDEITYGGAVLGAGLSLALPALHGVETHAAGLREGLIGAAVGAGLVYGVLRLGKLLFGRQQIQLPGESCVVFTETALHLPDQVIPYEELFYRRTDTISFRARRLELIDRSYWDVVVKLSPEALKIGAHEFTPESVVHLEALTSELTVPREAMGLGDVKFMAAIGAFLGWEGAVFALLASSVLGAAGGMTALLLRHRASSRIPYGPYLAAAAVLWLFGRHFFMGWLVAP